MAGTEGDFCKDEGGPSRAPKKRGEAKKLFASTVRKHLGPEELR
jgi:hypothetical protein